MIAEYEYFRAGLSSDIVGIYGNTEKFELTVTTKYDKNPGQTSWKVIDANTKKKIVGIGAKKSRKFRKNKKVMRGPTTVSAGSYRLIITDKKRNGFKTGYVELHIKEIFESGLSWARTVKIPGQFYTKKRTYNFMISTMT